MMKFFKYLLKGICIILSISMIYFYTKSASIDVKQKEIQVNIEKYLEKKDNSMKIKNFTIHKIDLQSAENENQIKAKINVDFETANGLVAIKNQNILTTLQLQVESDKFYVKIIDFDSEFMKKDEFKNQIKNSANNIVDNITGKLGFKFKDKPMDKIDKVLEIDNSKVKEFILNSLQKHYIKVYELKNNYFSIESVTIDKNNPFNVNVKSKVSLLILFGGILLLFLSLLREISILAIIMYQKFLSPKKGYICARNYYEGGGSCSERTKKTFKDNGVYAGFKEYFDTTKKCKHIYNENKLNESKDTKNNDLKNNTCNSCDNTTSNNHSCLILDIGTDMIEGIGSGCNVGHTSGCDVGVCDVGHCDGIGACDVGHC